MKKKHARNNVPPPAPAPPRAPQSASKSASSSAPPPPAPPTQPSEPQSSPLNSSSRQTQPNRRRAKPKDSVILDQHEKPVDTFHVRISEVKGNLRVVEARPVILSFKFDNFWYAETDIYARDTNPVWRFDTSSIRYVDPSRNSSISPGNPTSSSLQAPNLAPTKQSAYSHVARFIYETEFGYKLHKKNMIVRLCERSPYGDVEWGSALVPIDSIARGCEQLDLSIASSDGVKIYGNIYCKVLMVNIQKLRIHLTDLRLSDYPQHFIYDVKRLYIDLCVKPFENGYKTSTETRSDQEPRFVAQPILQREVSLKDMLISSSSGGNSLKICISAHRQLARDTTEEIGMGALPIRMLFGKVSEGWMDSYSKFKVPLANFKGTVRGKVILRNIPQYSQLPGSDLVNVDGIIMPVDVDLSSRKLLPWVKLPRSMDTRSRAVVPNRVALFVDNVVENAKQQALQQQILHQQQHYQQQHLYIDQNDIGDKTTQSKPDEVKCSVEESESSVAAENPSNEKNYVTSEERSVHLDFSKEVVVSEIGEGKERCPAVQEVEIKSEGKTGIGAVKEPGSEMVSSHGEQDRSKSGKSVGSTGTEIASVVLSATSEDGGSGVIGKCSNKGTGSSTSTIIGPGASGDVDTEVEKDKKFRKEDDKGQEDEKQSSSIESDNADHDNAGGVTGNENKNCAGEANETSLENDYDEWFGIYHDSSKQYYFVHRWTKESLWLPPNWVRMEDDEGRPYFVDHASHFTQRQFPVELARQYRDSVYAG